MTRVLYTVLACAAFLVMLTGTKRRPMREAGSIPKLTIPSTTGWTEHRAGIRFLAPPHVTITPAETPQGLRFSFAGEPELMFGPVDLVQVRSYYQKDYLMFDAPDAVIALEERGGADECRAAACTTRTVDGAPLCLDIRTTPFAHCADLVALVRSIEPLP